MSDTPRTDAVRQYLRSCGCLPQCGRYHEPLCPWVNPEEVALMEMEKIEKELRQALIALEKPL